MRSSPAPSIRAASYHKRGRLQPSSRAERDFLRRGAVLRPSGARPAPTEPAGETNPNSEAAFCAEKCDEPQGFAATWERQLAAGAPGGTRTPDLLVRSQTLYPAELLAHGLFSNSLIIISAKRKNVKRFLQVFEILLKRSRRGKGRERFPGFRPAAGCRPPCLNRPLKCSGDGCCG